MNREMFRGDTLYFEEAVYRDLTSGRLVGVPVGQQPPSGSVPQDITGYTVWFTAKNEYPDTDNRAVSQLSTGALGGVAILNANPGKFSVTMPPAATREFADSDVTLVYDLQVEDPSGRVSTIEIGTIVVSPDVTRATS